MSNPYSIIEPTCISFSGGRTSAYMLYQVIQAGGGNVHQKRLSVLPIPAKKMRQLLSLFKTVLRSGMLKFIGLNGAITI